MTESIINHTTYFQNNLEMDAPTKLQKIQLLIWLIWEWKNHPNTQHVTQYVSYKEHTVINNKNVLAGGGECARMTNLRDIKFSCLVKSWLSISFTHGCKYLKSTSSAEDLPHKKSSIS